MERWVRSPNVACAYGGGGPDTDYSRIHGDDSLRICQPSSGNKFLKRPFLEKKSPQNDYQSTTFCQGFFYLVWFYLFGLENKNVSRGGVHGLISGEVSHLLRAIKTHLIDQDWEEGAVSQFVQEVHRTHVIPQLIAAHNRLEFEAKKDGRTVFLYLLHRQVGARHPTQEYILSKPEILSLLCHGYSEEGGLISGPVLRECLKYEALAKVFLHSEDFYKLFDYTDLPAFDIAADAFSTLRTALCQHKRLSAEFLEENYDTFFRLYARQLQSDNYATRRQFLKLLSDILLERHFYGVMTRYISCPQNLKTMMVLLRDPSPSIQFEAFHVFKIFVANPHNVEPVLSIFARNKTKIIKLLENFLPERNEEEQFAEEKKYLIKQLQQM